jgi:S1-C subfamily serine protease
MKDIPVLFFFTGTHSDYHKPSDDWEKINYDGEAKVSRFVNSIALDLASGHQRPLFVRTPTTASMMGGGDTRGFSVTLGIIPDYGGSDEGMKIGGTRPNGPAEKAGMLSGDIIVKMAGKKILNIYDYMAVLGELEEGQEVEIEAIRKGELRKFTATMQKRK